ncbi:hypothetical protein PseudUWO310_09025 [Pseudanabaena sp. UWO310]|nr:hypothetical protein PseudUWO310_09025 [Pseudanabaena sp. UWO310]
MVSLELGQIKPQELTGGASRRQSILGVYILVHLAIAIELSTQQSTLMICTQFCSILIETWRSTSCNF